MTSPPIQLFLTTIASGHQLRRRQEHLLQTLHIKKIEFSSYDLASDEDAKRLWKRKAPVDKQQLPGILVGGKCPGTYADFEEAVEYGELDTFFRLKETWVADEDAPILAVHPIGVPGASTTLQMTPPHLKSKIYAPSPSPLKTKSKPVNKQEGAFDVSTELEGYGLQGVLATDEELRALVEELGLDGPEAGELVKGLGGAKNEETGGNKMQTEVHAPTKEGVDAEKVDVNIKETPESNK